MRVTARRCRSRAARSTCDRATWFRWPRWARSCPAAWRSVAASCGANGPTACCARRASSGWAATTRASSCCRPVSRNPAPPSPTRWASSATCSTTSRSTPTAPMRCRWPASPATWPPGCGCRSACPTLRSTRSGGSTSTPSVSTCSTRTCAGGSALGSCKESRSVRRIRPSPGGSPSSACVPSTHWSTCPTTSCSSWASPTTRTTWPRFGVAGCGCGGRGRARRW